MKGFPEEIGFSSIYKSCFPIYYSYTVPWKISSPVFDNDAVQRFSPCVFNKSFHCSCLDLYEVRNEA